LREKILVTRAKPQKRKGKWDSWWIHIFLIPCKAPPLTKEMVVLKDPKAMLPPARGRFAGGWWRMATKIHRCAKQCKAMQSNAKQCKAIKAILEHSVKSW